MKMRSSLIDPLSGGSSQVSGFSTTSSPTKASFSTRSSIMTGKRLQPIMTGPTGTAADMLIANITSTMKDMTDSMAQSKSPTVPVPSKLTITNTMKYYDSGEKSDSESPTNGAKYKLSTPLFKVCVLATPSSFSASMP